MRVLLSIKPEFAFRIFEGTKKYEYRRGIFKRDKVNVVVVYASAPIRKVIGEFFIEDILCSEPGHLWDMTRLYAGISKERFFQYFENRNFGYAIKIKRPKVYDRPVTLDKFMVSAPPQSFVYL